MGQGASDIRAGGAFYEVAGTDKLSPVLDKIQKRVATFAGYLSKAGNVAGLAGAGLAAPLTALFKGGADRAADLARLNLQTGVSIELLNKFKYAADAAGVSIDEVMQDWQGRYSGLIQRAPPIDAKAAKDAAAAQLELSDATQSLQLALLPLVRGVALYVTKIAEFVKQNAGAARTALAVGVGLLALGVTLKLLAVLMAGIIPVATAAWAAVTGPIGLGIAVGAVLGGGLFLGLAYLTDGCKALKAAGVELGDTLGTVFGGIADSIAKADIGTAWKILCLGLMVTWKEFQLVLDMAWMGMKLTWNEIVDGVAMAGNDAAASLEKAFVTAALQIGNMMKWMARTTLDAVLTAAEAMDKLDPTDSLEGAINYARGVRAALGATDAGAARNEIEARRAGIEAILREDAEKRKKDAGGEVLLAQAEIDRLKAQLAALRADAAKPAELANNPFAENAPLKAGLLGGISVKGSFSGAALGLQLGYGNEAVKQTELQKQIRDTLKDTPEQIAAALAPIIAGGFRVK